MPPATPDRVTKAPALSLPLEEGRSLRIRAHPQGLSRESTEHRVWDLLPSKRGSETPSGSAYRVQMGPYADAHSAELAKRLLDREGFKPLIRPWTTEDTIHDQKHNCCAVWPVRIASLPVERLADALQEIVEKAKKGDIAAARVLFYFMFEGKLDCEVTEKTPKEWLTPLKETLVV